MSAVRWIKTLVLLALCLSCSGTLLLAQEEKKAEAEAEKPDIEFETPTHDFGRAESGSVLEYVFTFKNTGTGTLRIEKITSKCGCFVAESFDRVVEPGESGKIPVRFETRRFRGKVSKPMFASTNVPEKKMVKFFMEGEIYDAIAIEPKSASFGASLTNTQESKYITLTNNLEEKIEIKSVKLIGDGFGVKLQVHEPGRRFVLEVSTSPPLVYGVNRASIEVVTNAKKYSKLEILAAAYVPPPIMVTPSSVQLAPVSRSKIRRTAFVRHSMARPFEVLDVRILGAEAGLETPVAPRESKKVANGLLTETAGGLSVRVIRDKDEKRGYRLVVDVPRDYPLGKEGLSIVIDTNSAEYPKISVPIKRARVVRKLTDREYAEAQLDRDLEREERMAMKRANRRALRKQEAASEKKKKGSGK